QNFLDAAATPPHEEGTRLAQKIFSKKQAMKHLLHKGALKQIFKRAFVSLCLCVSVFTSAQRPSRPPSAIQLNNLGVGYMNQARIAEALQMFRRAQTLDSSLFAARLNEGIALLNTQQLAEARDVLLDATRRQPQSARAWYNLGIVYRTLAQTDAAID